MELPDYHEGYAEGGVVERCVAVLEAMVTGKNGVQCLLGEKLFPGVLVKLCTFFREYNERKAKERRTMGGGVEGIVEGGVRLLGVVGGHVEGTGGRSVGSNVVPLLPHHYSALIAPLLPQVLELYRRSLNARSKQTPTDPPTSVEKTIARYIPGILYAVLLERSVSAAPPEILHLIVQKGWLRRLASLLGGNRQDRLVGIEIIQLCVRYVGCLSMPPATNPKSPANRNSGNAGDRKSRIKARQQQADDPEGRKVSLVDKQYADGVSIMSGMTTLAAHLCSCGVLPSLVWGLNDSDDKVVTHTGVILENIVQEQIVCVSLVEQGCVPVLFSVLSSVTSANKIRKSGFVVRRIWEKVVDYVINGGWRRLVVTLNLSGSSVLRGNVAVGLVVAGCKEKAMMRNLVEGGVGEKGEPGVVEVVCNCITVGAGGGGEGSGGQVSPAANGAQRNASLLTPPSFPVLLGRVLLSVEFVIFAQLHASVVLRGCRCHDGGGREEDRGWVERA